VSICRTLSPSRPTILPVLSRRTLTPCLTAIAIAAVLYVLFFHRLADRDLWSSHEARAAMDGQSTFQGDWQLPHLYDGRAEMQKPPLYYWLVALAAVPRGEVDAWAVRLPAALSALGCVAFLSALGWQGGRRFMGLAAGLIVATAVHFTWLARIGRIDMPLSLTTTLAIGCFHLAGSCSRPTVPFLLLAAYLSIAAGIMLKGPIGLILPLTVLAANRLLGWFLASRSPQSALGLWWGAPLVLGLTVPWFLWANVHTNGEFFEEFFWRHNVERGLGNGDLRSHAWWLYIPYFANDFLPWTPLLFAAAFWCIRRGWWRDDPVMRLGLVWLVVLVGGLSVASFKRGDYLLPAYPGAALFLACVVERWRREATGRQALIAAQAPLLLALIIGATAAGWLVRVHRTLPAQEAFRNYEAFAALIRRHAPAPEKVVFFRTEAHALAFHTGRPLQTLREWQDLNVFLQENGAHYIIMPPEAVREANEILKDVRWERVASNVELSGGSHERPLILLRAARSAER
jgi:4-amino-4-deoxy-L-arabinose transferase-like glycosyltransferase